MTEQTVNTQIRLLLEEQSDLGLHCLPLSEQLKCLLHMGWYKLVVLGC